MWRRVPWAVIGSAIMATALVAAVATYRPVEDEARAIGSVIRCPACQGVAISESPAPMARDMMDLVRERLDQGATRTEIVDELLASYTGSMLLDPPATGPTAALWLVPALAGVGGLALAATLRRSRTGVDADGERRELMDRRRQARADLEELSVQVAAGEVGLAVSSDLRAIYLSEIDEADRALAEKGPEPPAPRSPRRALAGTALVAGSLAVIIAAAAALLTEPPEALAGGPVDPGQYSDETLEAVVAANADHPQIDGMRLALAERHFAAGDHQAAFPHYLAVAESELSTDQQAATALTRLGWMAYGNGEVGTALGLLEEAVGLVPGDPLALYLQGLVRWCGTDDAEAAVALFDQVLSGAQLDPEIREEVEAAATEARSGEACE